jgi:hypothetical protein
MSIAASPRSASAASSPAPNAAAGRTMLESMSPDKGTTISFKLETGKQDLPFSDGLNKAIAEVIPSKEPIDQPDWSATEYINAVFPDGAIIEVDLLLSLVFWIDLAFALQRNRWIKLTKRFKR